MDQSAPTSTNMTFTHCHGYLISQVYTVRRINVIDLRSTGSHYRSQFSVWRLSNHWGQWRFPTGGCKDHEYGCDCGYPVFLPPIVQHLSCNTNLAHLFHLRPLGSVGTAESGSNCNSKEQYGERDVQIACIWSSGRYSWRSCYRQCALDFRTLLGSKGWKDSYVGSTSELPLRRIGGWAGWREEDSQTPRTRDRDR